MALPWQPPYQKRLHWPTEATKYQRAAQSVQEPWALGSRHRTGYAERGAGGTQVTGTQQGSCKRGPGLRSEALPSFSFSAHPHYCRGP